jgi:predicted dehydrogenase
VITIDYLSQEASFARMGAPSRGPVSDATSRDIFVRKVDLLETEIRSFLQSVRDRQPPRVSGRDGKRALEVALRIVRSAAEGTRQVRK